MARHGIAACWRNGWRSLVACALTAISVAGLLVSSSQAGGATTTFPATTGVGRYGIASGAALYGAPDDVFNADLDAIAGLGARWVRTSMRWSNVEGKEKGVFNWRVADRLVDGATARGLSLVVTIVGTPTWAQPSGVNDASYPPVNLADYADFASAAAARYRGRVHVWELGNEPNHATGWMPKPDAARYVELMKVTYPAIKASDPAAVVLTGGLGGTKSDATHIPGDKFVTLLYSYGGRPYFDAISYHPYTYPESPPARSWSRMLAARKTMEKNGDAHKKIWATEYGAPTNGPRPKVVVTEKRQAELVHEAYQLFASYSWSGPMMWFQHRDKGTDPTLQDNWFGLLRFDRTEKPSAAAYRARVVAAGG